MRVKRLAINSKKLLKTVVGFAVSLFFLWFAFRQTSFRALMAVPVPHRGWVAIALISLACGYALRAHRWWQMLRVSAPVSFRTCAFVLLISFGANNIFPLRLGDMMRIFIYSKELKAQSSIVFSTVILERILDLFALLALLLLAIENSPTFPWPRAKLWASIMLALATVGLVALMTCAKYLDVPLQRGLNRLADSGLSGKLKRVLIGSLDSFQKIGLRLMLGLMAESTLIWCLEGMVFVSAVQALALAVEWIAPWQALVLGNLSTLLPSTPGYVGTFDYAVKLAMTREGVSQSAAGFYALLVHALVWMPITVAGGASFLLLRYIRGNTASDGLRNRSTTEEMPAQ